MSIYSYSSFSLIPSFHFLRNPPVGKGDFLGGDFLPGDEIETCILRTGITPKHSCPYTLQSNPYS